MEKFNERELRLRLRQFEEVWRRVEGRRSPRETAERCGVRLMPSRPRRCGPRPPDHGAPCGGLWSVGTACGDD